MAPGAWGTSRWTGRASWARSCTPGGGVASADTQLVQRTFDLTWHTIHRGPAGARCAGALRRPIRAQQLRDLVQWNDRARPHAAPTSRRCCTRSSRRPRGSSTRATARRRSRPGIAPRRSRLAGACWRLQFRRYGGPEELEWAAAPEPHAGPGEIRVAVRAASVNPLDWKVLSGAMAGGAEPDGPGYPGYDAAGVVDEVGEGVTGVSVGDEVFGVGTGTQAEHAVLDGVGAQARLHRLGGGRGGGRRGRDRGTRLATVRPSSRARPCSSTAARAASARPSCRWRRPRGCG